MSRDSRTRLGYRTTHWPDPRPGASWDQRSKASADDLPRMWAQFLGRVPWTMMATLTFDPRRVFPVGQLRASREAWQWLEYVAWIHRRPVAWCYAPERGQSGTWHVHVLLTDLREHELQPAVAAWEVRNGHVHVTSVFAGSGAVLYATKTSRGSELVLSDTLVRFRDQRGDVVPVPPPPATEV